MAAALPVAQVMIDSPLPHLDHVFDYAVPAELDAGAVVGSRVRVRFAGRLTDAFVIGRIDVGEHAGALKPIERVIGLEPVLTDQTLRLVGEVAERYAGTFSDVVRSAVPPRHARAEGVTVQPTAWVAETDPAAIARWEAYDSGPALVQRLRAPQAPAHARSGRPPPPPRGPPMPRPWPAACSRSPPAASSSSCPTPATSIAA